MIRAKLLEYKNIKLRITLVNEKKHQKRGKSISLFIRDKPGQAIFFSLTKIITIRVR